MEHSTAVEYPSQVSLFMAGITKDLEEDVLSKTTKFAFNFAKGKPIDELDEERDFDWTEVS